MQANSKGVNFNDRKLAGDVRSRVLELASKYLADENHPMFKETYQALVKNVLPRLNEVTGENGEALVVKVINFQDGNNNPAPIQSEELPVRISIGNPSV